MSRKSARANFPPDVKKALAERVAYHCSFPQCSAATIGPSGEHLKASSKSGRACHIASAALGKGACRRVPTMHVDERKLIDNGIWMCATHADVIDGDETRFTIEMLKTWRRIAETRARIEHELGVTLTSSEWRWTDEQLAKHEFSLVGDGEENVTIGTALDDCCVSTLWGRGVASAVRDFLIEFTRNAFAHGGATSVAVEIHPTNTIRISDNGAPFDIQRLLQTEAKSGGVLSFCALHRLSEKHVTVLSRRLGNRNECTIAVVRSKEDLLTATPCALSLTREEVRGGRVRLDSVLISSCGTVYLILPEFFTISDIAQLRHAKSELLGDKRVVLVGSDLSDTVWERLVDVLPGCELMQLKD
jgi:hypothetical protein